MAPKRERARTGRRRRRESLGPLRPAGAPGWLRAARTPVRRSRPATRSPRARGGRWRARSRANTGGCTPAWPPRAGRRSEREQRRQERGARSRRRPRRSARLATRTPRRPSTPAEALARTSAITLGSSSAHALVPPAAVPWSTSPATAISSPATAATTTAAAVLRKTPLSAAALPGAALPHAKSRKIRAPRPMSDRAVTGLRAPPRTPWRSPGRSCCPAAARRPSSRARPRRRP